MEIIKQESEAATGNEQMPCHLALPAGAGNKPGRSAEVVRYAGAQPGLVCEERPSFHPVHAKEAWSRAIAVFARQSG